MSHVFVKYLRTPPSGYQASRRVDETDKELYLLRASPTELLVGFIGRSQLNPILVVETVGQATALQISRRFHKVGIIENLLLFG